VDPLLVEDRLVVHEALQRAASADSQVRYLCVESVQGDIVADTFPGGYPAALSRLWKENRSQVVRFRTNDEPLLDIPETILDGALGILHVGMSRAQAVKAADSRMLMIGGAFAAALGIIFIGAHIVAARVSEPLRHLEAEVSRFPHERMSRNGPHVSGTREVESLGKGFADMVSRFQSLERERTLAQQRMIHAERLAALGELAAGLAHEIHNPLDGMQECLRYLEADPNRGDRVAKYFPMLREGLQRIASVMRQMLTFARSGQVTSIEECSASDIVDSLALMLRGRLGAERVRLTWRKPGPCRCLCNRQALSQALLNLVLNAAEATNGSASPEIMIEAKCDSRCVYLAVEDSGPGVPEGTRDRIFEPFFTTKPVGRGTGLGLSISRQLIRAVGGELELLQERSHLGGARFVIRVPRVRSQECGDEEAQGEDSDS
jgi:signal transduction histidine kinase